MNLIEGNSLIIYLHTCTDRQKRKGVYRGLEYVTGELGLYIEYNTNILSS